MVGTVVKVKRILKIAIVGCALLFCLCSCATVSKESLAPGEVRLIGMEVSEREKLKEQIPFMITMTFEAQGDPEMVTACFIWSGKGPYCSNIKDVMYGSPGKIWVQLVQKYAGVYRLEGYVVYLKDGQKEATNTVSTNFHIFPAGTKSGGPRF